MGNLQAAAYAELYAEGNPGVALEAHLTSNHYPPIPAVCVPAAQKAIEVVAGVYLGNIGFDERVDLPMGITYKGVDAAPASAIVDGWHLDAFVEVEILRAQGVEGDALGEDYGLRDAGLEATTKEVE